MRASTSVGFGETASVMVSLPVQSSTCVSVPFSKLHEQACLQCVEVHCLLKEQNIVGISLSMFCCLVKVW